jgi:hypothetical protein
MKDKNLSIEHQLIDSLFHGPLNVWYKSSEKKADMLERKVDAYRVWSEKILLYLRMRIREEENEKKKQYAPRRSSKA